MANTPIDAFLDLPLQAFFTKLFPSHWLPFHINTVEIMVCGERGMNPVAMTVIFPLRKESGQAED